MIGKRKEEKREWISEETWKKTDKRGAAKNDTNTAKTRNLMQNGKRTHQEAAKSFQSLVTHGAGTTLRLLLS